MPSEIMRCLACLLKQVQVGKQWLQLASLDSFCALLTLPTFLLISLLFLASPFSLHAFYFSASHPANFYCTSAQMKHGAHARQHCAQARFHTANVCDMLNMHMRSHLHCFSSPSLWHSVPGNSSSNPHHRHTVNSRRCHTIQQLTPLPQQLVPHHTTAHAVATPYNSSRLLAQGTSALHSGWASRLFCSRSSVLTCLRRRETTPSISSGDNMGVSLACCCCSSVCTSIEAYSGWGGDTAVATFSELCAAARAAACSVRSDAGNGTKQRGGVVLIC